MRITSSAVVAALLLLPACSPPVDTDPDGGGDPGRPCVVQQDCWDCEACTPQFTEVCIDEYCRLAGPDDAHGDLILGSWLAVVTIPDGLVRGEIRSAAIRVYHPLTTEGAELTCADLLAAPVEAETDPTLNVLRALTPILNLSEMSDQTEIGVGGLPVGDDRLILVRLHDERTGLGDLVAVGCSEGLTVEEQVEGVTNKVLIRTEVP